MNIKFPVIVFRADGNEKIGLGHLIRTAALADSIKDYYHCILLTRCTIQSLVKTLQSSFAEIKILTGGDLLTETSDFLTHYQNYPIVLDGYHFDAEYQKQLFEKNIDLISIDDIHATTFYSSIIINQAGGLTPLDYKALPFTQFYLGPQYALLRKPFLDAAQHRNKILNNGNCLICFGGADPDNNTLKILKNEKIRSCTRFNHFHVVVGSAYNYLKELKEEITHQNITIYQSLSSEEMVSLMSKCSSAILSPSSVVYEYMSVGGLVFLHQIADNQKDVIKYFVDEGFAFNIKDLENINEESVEKSIERQSCYFDGQSGQRLKKIFNQFFLGKKFHVRRVSEVDMKQCFIWASDPEVRFQSYNSGSIEYSGHVTWFNQKLNDPDSYFYILEIQNKPVAQIRFQVKNEEAVLGYLADKSLRSKGLGTTILSKGIEAFTNEFKKRINISGYVKKSNIASQRSFEKLSFLRSETNEFEDSFKYTMSYGN